MRARFMLSALVCAVVLVGCGSTSSSSSTSATHASSSAGSGTTAASSAGPEQAVAAAESAVRTFEATQAPITVPPLPKAPPRGKSLALITCAVPSCETVTAAAAAAAKALGWDVHTYDSMLTPEGYQAAWKAVLQQHPDAIEAEAVTPNATVEAQLGVVTKDHIPFVEVAPADPPGGIMKATYNAAPQFLVSGQLMGDVVVADAKGPANTVVVADPSFNPILGPVVQGFTSRVKAAGGSVDTLQISAANVGKSVPGQVVNYLQSHPNAEYVAFELSDFDAGVASAMQAAGFGGKKIVARAPQASNLAGVKSGSEFAEVGEEDACNGYRAVDGLIRLMEGVPLGAFATDPSGWHQIFVKDNVTETSSAPPTPGCPSAFLKAWHVQ